MGKTNGIKKLFGKLIPFTIFFFLIVGASIGTYLLGPTPIIYKDDSWTDVTPYEPPKFNASLYNGILDQHSHTIYSDGKMTVRQNVEWHISMGYNIVFITDHNTVAAKDDINAIKAEYLARGVVIILGIEWTTSRFHMNILGIQDWTRPIKTNPSDEEIKAVIEEAHRQNAVVVLNHILWSTEQVKMKDHPTREQFTEWGIDFIEIVNDDSKYEYMYDPVSIPFCEENNVGQITGTDVHRPDALIAKAVHGWTYINVSQFTEEGVMKELRARRTTIAYDPVGANDHGKYEKNPAYLFVMPLAEFGKQFVALYEDYGEIVAGAFIYLGYAIVGFLIMYTYHHIVSKFWEKRNNVSHQNSSDK